MCVMDDRTALGGGKKRGVGIGLIGRVNRCIGRGEVGIKRVAGVRE